MIENVEDRDPSSYQSSERDGKNIHAE